MDSFVVPVNLSPPDSLEFRFLLVPGLLVLLVRRNDTRVSSDNLRRVSNRGRGWRTPRPLNSLILETEIVSDHQLRRLFHNLWENREGPTLWYLVNHNTRWSETKSIKHLLQSRITNVVGSRHLYRSKNFSNLPRFLYPFNRVRCVRHFLSTQTGEYTDGSLNKMTSLTLTRQRIPL